jgi:hypothetical protein
MRRRLAPLALCAAAGCATLPEPPVAVPDYITSPASCALVLGGGGTVFPEGPVAQAWRKIDGLVAGAATAELDRLGYRVELAMSDATTGAGRGRAAAAELARRRCNRVVQLSHFVEGEPGAMRFGYAVSVLVPDAARARRVEGGLSYPFDQPYARRYAWDLTSEAMDRLVPAEVGRQAAADLDQARVLTGRR